MTISNSKGHDMDNTKVTIRRETAESKIRVSLWCGTRDPEYKKHISTSIQFFNHMLETITWRSCINMAVDVELDGFRLTHVICEDVGLSLGEAYHSLFTREIESGINGSGSGAACIDEALARSVISFEERSLLIIDEKLSRGTELVEDMQQADLVSFFEGFAQGARCTLHIDLLRGVNPHHVWESVFRAFGESLRASFAPCDWRTGTTPGVKGKIAIEKD